MKRIRYLALLLTVTVLAGTLLGGLCLPAAAVEPTYRVSSAYQKSRFYENLKKVPLSGDQASDVIAIALSQLGYHEGNSDRDLGGDNLSGTRDFVEYNVLYGKLDNNQGNGLSYGYSWCASFVNWCLRQARVTKEASAAAEVSCRRWLNKATEAGIYRSKADYTPKQGDLIFFKDAGSQVSSTHIGLVLGSDGSKVYTVEGNTSNGSQFSSDGNYVALKSYKLTNSYIVGYAVPKYEVLPDIVRVDGTGAHLSTGLYISKEALTCYADPGMAGEKLTLEAHTVFSVVGIKEDRFTLLMEHKGREIEVYTVLSDKAVQLTADSETRFVAFVDDDGSELLPRRFLSDETTIVLPSEAPKKKDAGFLGWTAEKGKTDVLFQPGQQVSVPVGDLTLYAVWDYTFYLVSFKAPNGAILAQKYGYFGDPLELPQIESFPDLPAGYGFAGWDLPVPDRITEDAGFVAVYLPLELITDTETASVGETDTENVALVSPAPSGCSSSLGGVFGLCLLLPPWLLIFKRKRK